MKFLPLLWSNLMRRKVRTVCTALSIFVAFVLISALLSVRSGFERRGVELFGADRLVVAQKVSFTQPLPFAHHDRIASVPGVAGVTYAAWFRGVYRDPRNDFIQLAVDPETWFEMYRDLWSVPEDQLVRWKSNRSGAVIGKELAQRFGWSIGDRIPLQGTMWPKQGGGTWEFTIDGIYGPGPVESQPLDMMFFHYEYLNENRTLGRDLVDSYRVRVSDPARADEVARNIDAIFANSAYETRTSTENAFVRAIAEQIGDIGAIVLAILGPILFTLVLVCANTMAQAVRERANELAVLKTVGFTDGRILALVLAESSLLPVVAGGAGLVVWSFVQAGNPADGTIPMLSLSAPQIVLVLVIAVLLGLSAGFVPALSMYRLSVVDALRRER